MSLIRPLRCGNTVDATGGNALKYYSTVRLDIRRKESLRDNSGITVKVKVSRGRERQGWQGGVARVSWPN